MFEMLVTYENQTSISVPILFVLNFNTEYSAALMPCDDIADELRAG